MAREKVLVAPRGFPRLRGKGPYDGSCLKHLQITIFGGVIVLSSSCPGSSQVSAAGEHLEKL